MVTEVIIQEDTCPLFIYINYWIEGGITSDAVLNCIYIWDKRNQIDSVWDEVYNTIFFDSNERPNPLSKW